MSPFQFNSYIAKIFQLVWWFWVKTLEGCPTLRKCHEMLSSFNGIYRFVITINGFLIGFSNIKKSKNDRHKKTTLSIWMLFQTCLVWLSNQFGPCHFD
jgi:hypothetical protein